MLSFLDLPQELRDSIYQYRFRCQKDVFGNLRVFIIDRSDQSLADKWPDPPKAIPGHSTMVKGKILLALLLACRQIHNEAARLLYSQQAFSFTSISSLKRRVHAIGTSIAQLVKRVVLSTYAGDDTWNRPWARWDRRAGAARDAFHNYAGSEPIARDLYPRKDIALYDGDNVLLKMPNLLSIKVLPVVSLRPLEITDHDQFLAYQLGHISRFKTSTVITNIPGLTCLHLESPSFSVGFLENKPQLETLVFRPLTFETEWDEALSRLPKLKHLP
ncbi:hypothetical protein MMC13_007442 [Lambiella insularis]|nr:hypothetical protein [Lambiella insularis]